MPMIKVEAAGIAQSLIYWCSQRKILPIRLLPRMRENSTILRFHLTIPGG
jgi:hypothetical protein